MGFMSFGTGELLVLGLVLAIVFSASRMGALGNALGRFFYSFKKASRGGDLIDVRPLRREEHLGTHRPERDEDA